MPNASTVSEAEPKAREEIPAILIVDDEILIRFALAAYLQECGFRVFEAGNAAEAIEILEASRIVDIVFSDIRMPGELDGFGLAQWVRANRPGVPVILTSGDAKKTQAANELCQDAPFFAKPYDLKEVVAHIRTLIDAKRRR